MKTKLLLFVVSLLVVIPAIGAENANDTSAIRQIVTDQVKAWNAGDGKAFSVSFAEDGSFTNIRGTVFYGHRAFEDRHVEIFTGFFKGSKLMMSVDKIRFVRADVAVVDLSTVVSNLQGLPPGVRAAKDGNIHTCLQQVFVKNGNEWKVTSYHNVDVKE